MSIFTKIFVNKIGRPDKPPNPQEAIQKLYDIEELLQKKADHLEKKIEGELNIARQNGTKNKRGKKKILFNFRSLNQF